MNAQILAALLKAAEANPGSILAILQTVLDVLKANPELLAALLRQFGAGHSSSGQ